jgi:hypothetical protein
MSDQKWVLERLDRILELLERQVQLQEELMYIADGQDEKQGEKLLQGAEASVLSFRNPGKVPEEQANLAGYLLSILKHENYKDLSARLLEEEYVFPMITNQHWVN